MASSVKKVRLCQLPSPGNIAGRSSSITNAFFNAIIPIHKPTEQEELQALTILDMSPEDIRCAYCGDKASEWDHLRPLIIDKRPSGYITEIANLVPACGKCNQSKGKRHWNEWMHSSAPLSPKTRGKVDIEARSQKLAEYAMWRPPTRINFSSIISDEIWGQHEENLQRVLGLLQESQRLTKSIRETIENAPRHHNAATGEITYGREPDPEVPLVEDDPELIPHEEVFARLNEHFGFHIGESNEP